jgi:replication-associated recombination protein RarA
MGLLDKLHFAKTPFRSSAFAKIMWILKNYVDLKDIIERALETDENYNLLLIGRPASSKTLFLMGILESRKDSVYFDGSNTTNRILDVLEEKRPKIILLDELDKMGKSWQNQLLNFMESGRVDVEQQRKQYHFEIKGAKVFGTANDISRLSKPLQSRFRKLFLPKYTEQQFIDVSIKVLPKVGENMARYIGFTVFKNGGDIRDVMSVGKLIRKGDGPQEVEWMINTMTKYGAKSEA